jgi:hypothetical protein
MHVIVLAPVAYGTATVAITDDGRAVLFDSDGSNGQIPLKAARNLLMASYPLPDDNGNPASRSVSGCVEVVK